MADKLLKSIKFPTLPDRYVIGDSTLTEEGAAAEAKAVGDALATKADTKGTYEDLIVGGAEQLMADGYETDKEPYLFRPTGVGNREYLDKIVGGTVAWNQLVKFGTNVTNYNVVSDYEIKAKTDLATATYPSFSHVWNGAHKYLVRIKNSTSAALRFYTDTAYTQDYIVASNTESEKVLNITSVMVENNNPFLAVGTGVLAQESIKANIFDLTAMFGSTIADYIYSLEQANAGAGVAWFRNYFPKDYYPYDPGTLRSVEGVSAHETVGFNQWDEEWELGNIDNTTGENITSASVFRSKNYIPVLPNTTYYSHYNDLKSAPTASLPFYCYDASKNYLGRTCTPLAVNNSTFVTDSDTHYIRFRTAADFPHPTVYQNDICINLSDPTRNGEYEPYTKHTYPLDSSLTLRGVPKLVDGKLAYDGDVYPPSGEVQRRYGYKRFTNDEPPTIVYSVTVGTDKTRVVCNGGALPNAKAGYYLGFMSNAFEHAFSSEPNVGKGAINNGNLIFGAPTTVTTKEEAVAYLANLNAEFVYELATPTTETADGYEHYQICDPSGTEEFVTDSIVPVGHETRYPHDLKKKIESAPDSPSTDGTYLMKRSGGKNAYMALPSTPSANGAYVLTVTVSGGTASYSWTAKE